MTSDSLERAVYQMPSDSPPEACLPNPPPRSFRRFERSEIEQSIVARFERQVRDHPSKTAIAAAGETLTYQQLNQGANRIAAKILTSCPERQVPVALLLEQGPPLTAAILGTLKAGMFFVCLDPPREAEHNAAILRDSAARLLLTVNRCRTQAQQIQPRVPILLLDDIDPAQPAQPADDPRLAVAPDHLAYIFYTTGSTGQPKGVVDCHRNVLHNIMRYTNSLQISPDDRLSLLQAGSFSGSISSLFAALLNGATSCPFDLGTAGPDRLASWVADEQITIFHAVPSIFRLIAGRDYRTSALRIIRLEGDQASTRDLRRFQDNFPATCTLVNGLGATECGLVRQFFFGQQSRMPRGGVPLGYHVQDMDVAVTDETGTPLAECRLAG